VRRAPARDADNDAMRRRLWAEFSGPAVALFSADSPDGADDPTTGDAERDARAVLALAAGAALLLSTVAVEDDTDAVHHRIAELLTEAVTGSYPNSSRV
jgi:hypothetical protein